LTDHKIAELESMGFLWNLQTRKPRQKRTKFEDACFDQRVQELKAYRDTNGHCRVPTLYKPNKALGWWVNKVRTQYTWRGQGKKTSLTDARIWELDNLGFVWNGNEALSLDVWKKRVQELVAYRDTNGHCQVPAEHKPNKALGWWVNKVRTQYTWRGQGKKTSLTDARISELDGLGFAWKAGTKEKEASSRDVWKKRVQELVAYRDTNGHCRVPFLYKPNKALGHWVDKVRTRYTSRGHGKKTALTDARVSELDGLGFVWKVRKAGTKEVLSRDELWKKRVQELVAYRDTNGHCRVPFLYKPNKALGNWVNKVRTQYTWRGQGKKTSLTDAHISELDGLGFAWKAGTKEKEALSRDVWKKQVQELVAYRDTNGHCQVPFLYKPNKALGNWVNKVRTQYTWRGQGKKTALTDARVSELDGLGFVWKVRKAGTKEGLSRDELWKKRVQELVAYRDTNGHCWVPARYEPNKALGHWVSKVRTQYTWRGQGKKTSLTDARISELDSLGFVWEAGTKEMEGSPRDEVWKQRQQELTAFNNKYLETYPLNPLLLHKQREELLRKQTEELLQKLLSRRRDYDLYLWALRSYPL
jgi:hypothetical protein